MATKTVTTKIETTAGDAEPLERYRGPLFDVIASIADEEWGEHRAKVYRADESWDQKGQIALEGNVFTQKFDEDTIRQKWGGGRYLVWLYGPPNGSKVVRGSQRVTIEGAPKFAPHANGNGSGELQMVLAELLSELRAARGGDATNKAMQGALDLQANALKSGIETVRALGPTPAAKTESETRMERLMDKLLEISLMRMMEGPRTDPMMDKIQTAMLDRLVNPTNPLEQAKAIILAVKDLVGGTGGGKTDLASIANTFVTNLPSLLDKGLEGVREYRLANESAERMFKLQRGDKVIDVQPSAASSPATPSSAAANPTPAQPPAPQAVEGPSLEWIQLKMVDAIEKDADAAGEWLYDWFEHIAPELNKQLSPMTPEQIRTQIFEAQPILARVAKHPKLGKVIEDYLKAAKEAAANKPS